MIITQEELKALIDYYQNDMTKHGYKFIYKNIIPCIVDKKSFCAETSYDYDFRRIDISFSSYYIGAVNMKMLRNTIIHELIHCLKPCEHEQHGRNWQRIAKYFSIVYNTNISTYSSREENKLTAQYHKYKIICPNCGVLSGVDRMSTSRKEKYKYGLIRCCRCHSVVKLEE